MKPQKAPFSLMFVSPSAEIGGAEKVVLSLAEGLLAKEIRVYLLTQDEGSFTREFRRLGGQAFILKMPAWRKGKSLFSKYIAALKMRRLLLRLGTPIVHCNSFRLTPYFAFLEKIMKVKYLIHVHDFPELEKIKKFKFNKNQNIVVVSRSVAADFLKAGIAPRVILNAVQYENFRFQTDKFKPKKMTLGLIANYFAPKRHFLFLDIAAALKKIMPGMKFEIVGSNIGRTEITEESLNSYASKAGIAEDVTLLGCQKDVSAFLARWDAFLLTSENEPFGLVLLEAMASGCVVFADCNAGGPSEIIEDELSGFLLDCRNVEASAARIANVLENRSQCLKVTARALAIVQEQYNHNLFFETFLRYYQSV